MLQGEEEFAEEAEDVSAFEAGETEFGQERAVSYNRLIPIETFDFIVTDECHRSIYKVWRQVLEYFDAFIVGLTATPSKQTLGFFNNNLVMEYPYERSVADGVNVGYEIYRIKTQVSEKGSRVAAGYALGVRDRRTRRVRWEELDRDFEYKAKELDRSVTAPDQIRTILKALKEKLPTELFPGRNWLPKTLIFAKDDNHAEEIVHIAREVFEVGNDFVKKITYRTMGEAPADLIRKFRNDPLPRIAVTVDMIATGTDIKPVEIVMFMRDVRSEIYFEQMKGRGCRTIEPSDLQAVTGDARTKDHFVLIDAVGVTELNKTDNQPLERKRKIPFDRLLDQIAQGKRDDDSLSTLSARLAALAQRIKEQDHRVIAEAAGGKPLASLAGALLEAVDPDVIEREVQARHGAGATKKEIAAVVAKLKDQACAPFDRPQLRRALKDIKSRSEIAIDEVTADKVTYSGYDFERARRITRRFQDFIEHNKDQLTALQIIYGQPYGKRHLSYAAIRELTEALERPPNLLTTANLWQAYQRLEGAKVRKVQDPQRLLTNVVSLVRFAAGLDDLLEPFDARVEQRFNLWIGRQMKAGRSFTPEQMEWLRLIKDHVATNVEIARRDFQESPAFTDRGGVVKVRQLFGKELGPVLEELNEALVA